MGQLFLGGHIEEVALVLLFTGGLAQEMPAVFLPNAGVVTGGDVVKPPLLGPLPKGGEFDGPVADDTGVGGAAPPVFPHKVIHHLGLEFPCPVDDMVGHPQLFTELPGAFNLPLPLGAALFIRLPQAEGGTLHPVTLPLEQQ